MTCKDCLYYAACKNLIKEPNRIAAMNYGNSEKWACFKDKTRFVELPCKVGTRTTPIKCDFCPFSFLDVQGILRCESGGCKLDAETIDIMFRKIYDKKEVTNNEL